MDETADKKSPLTDPGLTVSELMSGIYLCHFTSFSKDKKINAAQAQYYLDQVTKNAATHPDQKINVINDTTLIQTKVRSLSTEARQAYLKAYSLPEIGYVAMVGFNPWLKNFIRFLAQAAGQASHTKFFDTREEGITWLKQLPPT